MLISELSLPELSKFDKENDCYIENLLFEKIFSMFSENKLKLNINGHFRNTNPYNNPLSALSIDNTNLEELYELYDSFFCSKRLKKFIFCGSYFDICSECGKEIAWECDGSELRATTKCDYPDGFPAYEILLNVPSGRLVIEDDLKQFFDIDLTEAELSQECGHVILDRKISKIYEKVGMVHGYIGNTHPLICREDNELFIVDCNYSVGKIIGQIETNLWWYSIADYSDIVDRFKKINKNSSIDNLKFSNVIDVEPGMYVITHQQHLNEEIFASIRKL